MITEAELARAEAMADKVLGGEKLVMLSAVGAGKIKRIVAELRALEKENGQLREALRVIDYTARSRGYPTGKEWAQLVQLTRAALEGE
jgi:hypothetical protein